MKFKLDYILLLILLAVGFSLGIILAPHVRKDMNYSEQHTIDSLQWVQTNRENFLELRDSLKLVADVKIADARRRYDSLTQIYGLGRRALIIHSKQLDTMGRTSLNREVHQQYVQFKNDSLKKAGPYSISFNKDSVAVSLHVSYQGDFDVTTPEIRFLLRQNDIANLAPVQESRIHQLEIGNEALSDKMRMLKADSVELRVIDIATTTQADLLQTTLTKERKEADKQERKLRRQKKFIAIVAGIIIVGETVLLVLHGD